MISAKFGNRLELDGLPFIDTVSLKDMGFFDANREGALTWSHPLSGAVGRINISVDIGSQVVHLRYVITNNDTGEKRDMDYYISLTATPCNFGGKRWWFLCPLVLGGKPCHGRVRRLYKGSDFFACRNCQNLCYSQQNENHQDSFAGLTQVVSLERRVTKLQSEIKVPYYNGRPTRKMRQYLKLVRILEANNSVEDYITNLSNEEV